MTEYRVFYRPYAGGDVKILFVEAEDEETAKTVAIDHIDRVSGYMSRHVCDVQEYVRPTGGRVLL